MSLEDEVKNARTEIKSDGYDMSLGEIINLYKDGELIIDPEYQRLFRWDETRKTRFIESLLLGIPIPPIFVFQHDTGIWELIDGLQRVSTILQLTGDLRVENVEPLVLEGTNYLPSLTGRRWEDSSPDEGDGLHTSLQIQLKRSRLRVEILQPESDPTAKYELFQRLNTGGAGLSQQEVRNCIAVMIDKDFFHWLRSLSEDANFVIATAQTDVALESQAGVELALRLLAFRFVPYERKLDVHEYLDHALVTLASDSDFDRSQAALNFATTFEYLRHALGDNSFKRWDGHSFRGKFLMSVFEVLATGIFANIYEINAMNEVSRKAHIEGKAKLLWQNETFSKYSGAGIRGTTRLTQLLPMAAEFLKP